MANFPQDVDGDVFRRLEGEGFDFDSPCTIDFNVDFGTWPPPQEAVTCLRVSYPDLEIIEPNAEGDEGYIQVHLHEQLSYELVVRVQAHATELVRPYGGECNSWGVLRA